MPTRWMGPADCAWTAPGTATARASVTTPAASKSRRPIAPVWPVLASGRRDRGMAETSYRGAGAIAWSMRTVAKHFRWSRRGQQPTKRDPDDRGGSPVSERADGLAAEDAFSPLHVVRLRDRARRRIARRP